MLFQDSTFSLKNFSDHFPSALFDLNFVDLDFEFHPTKM